jgi:hypothetical protein
MRASCSRDSNLAALSGSNHELDHTFGGLVTVVGMSVAELATGARASVSAASDFGVELLD